MKIISRAVAVLLAICANNAWADRGDQYVLGKVGFMSVDLNNADPLFSIGALYGYGITPEITAEGEINLGLLGGEYKQKDSNSVVIDKGDYFITTLAGYGVYRLPVTDVAYIKGKLGLLYESVQNSSDNLGDKTATGFGLAGGIGAGGRIADTLTLEGEITFIDQDIIFYSLGMHYSFK